eukprot:m.465152 g.465152  ORF g.465152 m.465152 type:complete len:304 (+) comp21626_c1_seq23:239-1150(+)
MILVMRQFTKALLVYTFGVHGWMHRSHSHNVQMRPVSLYWDTDNSDLVTDIPPGIIHAGAHGSNAPPTGNNGHTVNIYGNKGYFPHFLADGTAINGGLPQACNLTLHISRLEYDIRQLVPDPSFSGVCLLDFEQIRADWNSTEEIYRKKSIEVGGQRITYLALPENKRANITNAIAAYEDGARTLFLATINAAARWAGMGTRLTHCHTPSRPRGSSTASKIPSGVFLIMAVGAMPRATWAMVVQRSERSTMDYSGYSMRLMSSPHPCILEFRMRRTTPIAWPLPTMSHLLCVKPCGWLARESR